MRTSQVRNAFSSHGREVGGRGSHTHTQLVCTISWTHVFTPRRSLTQTHTQVHTHPNAHRLMHLIKCVYTPICVCTHTGHTHAQMHTLTDLGLCTHTLIHTHMHTQTRPTHSLENGTLTRRGHCPNPRGSRDVTSRALGGLGAQRGLFTG